jgi:hypothetical protein
MLGKSWGQRGRLLLVVLLLVGCARNISGDSATGDDGKVKGAKPIELDNNEGRATGIVTYPGGDRVDWKVLELPADKRGTLEFKLTWTPPRPGLQLAFDVFDQYGRQVAGTKRKTKKRASRGKIRTATVKDAKGKYFIRIQAVDRGDAGKYRLSVEFKEGGGDDVGPDILAIAFPDPPKLPDIPQPEQGCDEFAFDPKIPACKSVCPEFGAPQGWPACKGKCPNPPSVDIEACHATMPCPRGQPDERIKACKAADWPPCPDKNNPDMRNPNCRVKAQPIVGRILGKRVEGSEVVITIGAGTNQGVKRDWNGQVLRGSSLDSPNVPGGDFKVYRADTDRSYGRVKLSPDQVSANPYVRLSPP